MAISNRGCTRYLPLAGTRAEGNMEAPAPCPALPRSDVAGLVVGSSLAAVCFVFGFKKLLKKSSPCCFSVKDISSHANSPQMFFCSTKFLDNLVVSHFFALFVGH